jgi:hypothetical protein
MRGRRAGIEPNSAGLGKASRLTGLLRGHNRVPGPHLTMVPTTPRADPGSRRLPLDSGRMALMIGTLWQVLTMPIRIVFWTFSTAGRLIGLVIGFAMMVGGAALWSGPFYPIGIPLFVVGLLLTLRNLG